MEPEVLNRITKKLLKPKFWWIDDINWYPERMGLSNYWTCEVTKSESFVITPVGLDSFRRKLGNELESIFRMVNNNPEDIFMEVKIITGQ